MAEPLRCSCANWLGVLHQDGRVEVKHRGRRLIGRVDEIVCEKCGEVWRSTVLAMMGATLRTDVR